MLIPTLMLIFSVAGAAFGIEEETLPFFPVLIPIFIAAGYDSLVGLSVIKIGAALGVMASIANPFAVAIASKFAGDLHGRWNRYSVLYFSASTSRPASYLRCIMQRKSRRILRNPWFTHRPKKIKSSS